MLAFTCGPSRFCRLLMRTVYIGTTLVTPWASVLAQEDRGSVQILAAFSTRAGRASLSHGATSHPWLRKYASWIFRNRQSLCGSYSDDNMKLLELQTLYASASSNLMNSSGELVRRRLPRAGPICGQVMETAHFQLPVASSWMGVLSIVWW